MSNTKRAKPRAQQLSFVAPEEDEDREALEEIMTSEEPLVLDPNPPKAKKKAKKKKKKKRKKATITYYYEEDDSCFDKVMYCAYDSLVGWWRD